jgi:hypothetical protein
MAGNGRIRIPHLLVAAALAAGCAGEQPAASPAAEPAAEYTATTTVLESPEHGPQLCLGGVLESYPPQCGGPDVVGLDWAEVDGEESANGTTWGTFAVTGTWDGASLTLTRPVGPPEPLEPDHTADAFASPCEPPSGGWSVVDPSVATEENMQAAIDYARAQPSHAGVWLDQLHDVAEERPFDAAEVVLNLRFTADLDRHEAAVRRLWGGPLCIVEAEHTLAELEAVAQRLHRDLDGVLMAGPDEVTGTVEITLPVVDGQLRSDLRDRYGDVVEVSGALRPVE